MKHYIYPTGNNWFNKLKNQFKQSNKYYVVIPWLYTNVHTLPKNNIEPFWLYMYYSLKSSDENQGYVYYRCRVVEWARTPFNKNACVLDIHHHNHNDNKVFFKIDCIEDIKSIDNKKLRLDDFEHIDKKTLSSTIRNSIPQVTLLTEILVCQRTGKLL